MAKPGSDRREDALSRERIVEAAIELLDDEGEAGLTFRALATRLATGPGAIYWHVANKLELLTAAGDAVVDRALAGVAVHAAPATAIRKLAVRVFDAVDAHPWVGAQLSRTPWPAATLQIFERIGRQIEALGVSSRAQFTSATALVSYIIGVSVQNAAQGRRLDPAMDRAYVLELESIRWTELDARAFPFTRRVATQLRKHDDRDEFVAGLDLILAGVAAAASR